MNYLHSGGCGDIVYALKIMQKLGPGTLYMKSYNDYNKHIDMFITMEQFLRTQSYIADVKNYPATPFFTYDKDIQIDVDLDKFRRQAGLMHFPLIQSYYQSFNIPLDPFWSQPWLERFEFDTSKFMLPSSYALVTRTPRYRDANANYLPQIEGLIAQGIPVIFVGLEDEYKSFTKEFCDLPYRATKNVFQLAGLAMNASHIISNQTLLLTLAQGYGIPYTLEIAPKHTNCIFRLAQETLMNPKILEDNK